MPEGRSPVGFGGAQGYLAGDEMNGTGGPMTARYAGSYPWQRAQGKDGCCYFTIQSIGSLPSPFTISGP